MTPATTAWRATAVATALSLATATVSPTVAAPPPIGGGDPATPPGRVGRLAQVAGTVSFHTADQTAWSPAALNYPVTSGNAFWTEPGAGAAVEVSGNRIAMDAATELDIAALDDHTLVASEPQGALFLELAQVPNGDSYTVQTPRGAVQIAGTGRFEVVSGDTNNPTTVTVVDGAAQVTGTNVSLQVGPNQTATISGSDSFQGAVGPIAQDAFLARMLAAERPRARPAGVPQVVAQMTGASDLERYGSWSPSPQYGTVWYPQVDSGWVPYRHGRWSYVAPWGWTWVDEAPWGFAPFHYGRWIQADDRWGWVPAQPVVGGPIDAYPQPVYAPALVSFVDIGAAAAVGAAVGFAAGAALGGGRDRSVGWFPLGPNEPYYPPYSHSVNYIRSINGANVHNVSQVITDNSVHNVTNITNNSTVVQNFVNRGGATVVPAAAMVQSAPIAAAARPMSAQQLTQARPQFAAPVAPTAATAGVTPAVARQFHIAAPAAAAAAAGPAINPAAFRPAGPRQAAAAFVPPLRPAAGAAAEPVKPFASPEPGRPATAAEPVRPGLAAPAAEPGRPNAAASPAAEAARPGVLPSLRPATPAGEAPHAPGTVPTPGEPNAARTPEAARPAEPGRPNAAASPAAEAARPGVLPSLRPATPAGEAPHAPGTVPTPGEPNAARTPEAARPAEPGRPGEPTAARAPQAAPAPEPSRAAEPSRPAEPGRAAEPSRAAEPGRPAEPGRAAEPNRAPAMASEPRPEARPAPLPSVQRSTAAPERQAAPAPRISAPAPAAVPRAAPPAPPPRPAPPQRPEPPRAAERPTVAPRPAPPPPRPQPIAARPAPPPRPAPAPPPHPAPEHNRK